MSGFPQEQTDSCTCARVAGWEGAPSSFGSSAKTAVPEAGWGQIRGSGSSAFPVHITSGPHNGSHKGPMWYRPMGRAPSSFGCWRLVGWGHIRGCGSPLPSQRNINFGLTQWVPRGANSIPTNGKGSILLWLGSYIRGCGSSTVPGVSLRAHTMGPTRGQWEWLHRPLGVVFYRPRETTSGPHNGGANAVRTNGKGSLLVLVARRRQPRRSPPNLDIADGRQEGEMEGKEEDVRLGANKFAERQPIGTAAQSQDKDYKEPPPAPLFEPGELSSWSFYRAGIAEFMATFLFLYITILTVMGVVKSSTKCSTVGIQGIAWAFGGMIFALVYCTAGISGGHINPAVTFGLFLARKLSLTRALFYIVMQCLGAICGAGVVKGFQKGLYENNGGGANVVAPGYTKGDGLGAEIVGTFILVYTVFSATDAKRSARDSHVPILAPLPIGFAVFLVHLATIPITGTGINPARSLGAAIIYNKDHAWDDHVTPSTPGYISVMVLLAELTRLPALVVGVDLCNALPLPALARLPLLPFAVVASAICSVMLPATRARHRRYPLPQLLLAVLSVTAINPCSNDYSRQQSLPSSSDTIFPAAAASSPSSSCDRNPPLQHRHCTLLQPSLSDPFSRQLFLFRGSFSRKPLLTPEQRDPLVLLQ
ncbi:hypothetical protein BHM03_00036178 [Ensete ventricosum]|nr:hypothetical protein BHM03_00036178 [Ensete ventricosum]